MFLVSSDFMISNLQTESDQQACFKCKIRAGGRDLPCYSEYGSQASLIEKQHIDFNTIAGIPDYLWT